MDISKLLLLLITLITGILVGVIIPGIWRKYKEEEKIEVK
jgi:hypothetical protein